jgi:hypothetical protein
MIDTPTLKVVQHTTEISSSLLLGMLTLILLSVSIYYTLNSKKDNNNL